MMTAMSWLARQMPTRESRRPLIALLAYLALLMPALLPYGAFPANAVLGGVAPHVHADGVDANLPHEHGGGSQERIPADTPFVLSHPVLAALLAEPPRLPLPRATKPPFVAAAAPAPSGNYEPGQPRGPPPQV